MRILILLNPTNKRGTKAEYTAFRKFIVSDGFLLLQPEVYVRTTNSRKAAQKHIRRIQKFLPSSGSIRMICLTERQYEKTLLLEKTENQQEQIVGCKDYVDA